MRKISTTDFLVTLAVLALLPACTLVTGAGDYEVESSASKPDAGNGAGMPGGASGRNLDFTMISFSAHAGIPVDIAVVSQSEALQARAIVLMPPDGSGVYPPERVELEGVLLPGKNKLFFFADKDRSGDLQAFMSIDGKKVTAEHSWIVDIPANGVLKFPHGTNFREFTPDAFSQQSDIVFRLPQLAPDASAMVQTKIREQFESALGDIVEIGVFASDDGRQVGLYRRHAGTTLPEGELRLPGIADPGSLYDFELSIDGDKVQELTQRAPIDGDMTILAAKWLPASAVALFPGAK